MACWDGIQPKGVNTNPYHDISIMDTPKLSTQGVIRGLAGVFDCSLVDEP